MLPPLRAPLLCMAICFWTGVSLPCSRVMADPKVASKAPSDSPNIASNYLELAAPALVPPTVNTNPLPDYDYDKLDYGMTIGIERTPQGRLWACWVGGGDSDLAFFVLASSDDDGETWSKPRVVIDPHDASLPFHRRTVVGNLWTDPQGRLWLFFDQSMSMYDGRAGDWYTICDNPDAENPSWSKPVRFADGMTLNKPIVLSNGEWLVPVSLWPRSHMTKVWREGGAFGELDPQRMAQVYVSGDEGRTWSRRGGVAFPNTNFDEHMIVQRRDGSLWMTARTHHDIWESLSTDDGRTWSPPQKSNIAHLPARHFIRRLASGNILLVKHGKQIDERTNARDDLTAYLSDDEGKTWKEGLLLDEREPVSYPDGFQAPDGSITISYDYDRNRKGQILMARFTEDDVLAGKIVSPNSQLKMLISEPLAIEKRLAAERARKQAAKQQQTKMP